MVGETFAYLKDPRQFALDRHRQYGPIFQSHVLGRPTIALSGAEALRWVFTNERRYVEAVWPSHIARLVGEHCLPNQHGAVHSSRRKIVQDAFATPVLAGQVPEMERIARIHLDRWRRERAFAWCPRLGDLVFHAGCSLILGDESLLDLAGPFQAWIEGMLSLPLSLPWSTYGRAERAFETLCARVERVVRRRLADPHPRSAKDILSVLLRSEGGAALSIAELTQQILLLLIASYEATSSALSSMCMLLAQHPGVFDRLCAEQRAIGLDRPLDKETIDRMSYLDQVIREVLRVYPPVSGAFRDVLETCEFGGYRIPKGWRLMYHIASTHMDEDHFEHPDRFDPDRFGPDRIQKGDSGATMVTFAGGPRLCVGKEYAGLMIRVLGALLARRYRWTLEPGQDLSLATMPVVRPRSGLKVRFVST